jgi:ergothioneine biosynthesis protein EgtB
MANQQLLSNADREQHLLHFLATRERSITICDPLETEDFVIQTMPDVSPPKWHLAHTSWFFETFLLVPYSSGYQVFHPLFDSLFNSYYITHGDPHPRPERGFLSRPTVKETIDYRNHVDIAMRALIENATEELWLMISPLLTLGINHEQQHQELLLTDIKHILAMNPLQPDYRKPVSQPREAIKEKTISASPLTFQTITGGLVEVGYTANDYDFSYDNESPAHKTYLDDFKLGSRCITNEEYITFIEDDGYQRPAFWLSEGWAISQQQRWCAPLYWQNNEHGWSHFTFEGLQKVDLSAPVCHVSYYEAAAYACWAEKRLPTEHEWEVAAQQQPMMGNLFEQQRYKTVTAPDTQPLNQLYGDVWEWTASPYVAYPGYKPPAGVIGEYNGKFMSNQMVLRGGSFATAQNHIRTTYRNFFYPQDRWQFSGIRLADDL